MALRSLSRLPSPTMTSSRRSCSVRNEGMWVVCIRLLLCRMILLDYVVRADVRPSRSSIVRDLWHGREGSVHCFSTMCRQSPNPSVCVRHEWHLDHISTIPCHACSLDSLVRTQKCFANAEGLALVVHSATWKCDEAVAIVLIAVARSPLFLASRSFFPLFIPSSAPSCVSVPDLIPCIYPIAQSATERRPHYS